LFWTIHVPHKSKMQFPNTDGVLVLTDVLWGFREHYLNRLVPWPLLLALL
jgi:hypothetical protein